MNIVQYLEHIKEGIKKDSKTKNGEKEEELESDDECDDISTIDETISMIKKIKGLEGEKIQYHLVFNQSNNL